MLKKLIVLMFVASIAHSATYYISPTGNNDTGNGSNGSPWLTLQKGMAEMSGGDTLIVKDGTYTGASNQITANQKPPVGTSGAWTIIKAEHDGMAVFDGENARETFYWAHGGEKYVQFEGLVWCRSIGSCIGLYYCSYVKFLRCGAYDAANENNMPINVGRENSYILLENCYTYGNGRYGICVYLSSACVVRQCVVRVDRDKADGPLGGISIYSSNNVEVQNCIVIDSDQEAAWDVAELAGAFNCPATDYTGNNISFRNCISLNNKFGGLCSSALAGASNIIFDNCVSWDTHSELGSEAYLNLPYGYDTSYLNCTFGVQPTSQYVFLSRANNETTLRNCIVYDSTYTYRAMRDIEFEGYNSFYKVANVKNMDASGYDHDISPTDILNINPIWNAATNPAGALKYIVRTEPGNSLSTRGEGGGQIGANATTLVGVQGTLCGEAGYNTNTGISMWPFPYEDLIKEKFAAYSVHDATYDVDGDRGFAATGKQLNGTDDITLTSYIWEYLGNEMPADIYGESEPEEPATAGITITGVTITGGISISAD